MLCETMQRSGEWLQMLILQFFLHFQNLVNWYFR